MPGDQLALMYKTGSSSRAMGSLRRDYVARIPIDLNCSPLSSKAIPFSSQYNTPRILINNSTVSSNGVSVVRCRIDSENGPNVVALETDYRPEAYVGTQQQHQQEVTSVLDSVRSCSTSSESRETGSILKRPEFSNSTQTLNSDRSKRTSQGRRRVRFTNNVSMYRFDSDGVDSAYSSSECERFSAAPFISADRKTAPSKYATSTIAIQGGSVSNNKQYAVVDDTYGTGHRSLSGRRIQDEKQFPSGIKQDVRGVQAFHGAPSSSLYFRNNLDKTKSGHSAHWMNRASPTLISSQKQGPPVVGSSGPLKATNYTLVSDPVTQEKRLVVTAKLSNAYHPNDITVKANKHGNKIRIVSSKAPSAHQVSSMVHQSRHHQINEQILLPVEVDPYKLTARLDPNGSLIIEAPCVV